MNKIYIIITAFAVLSGASVATDYKKKPGQPEKNSEVFEHLNEDQVLEEGPTYNVDTSEEMKRFDTPDSDDAFDDAKRIQRDRECAEDKEPRYGLRQYVKNVRMAMPHVTLAATMGLLTLNEMTHQNGPDASLIPVSSLALLGGYHALNVIRSGQYAPYNIIPNTMRDAVRTGVSLVPGMAYSLYHQITAEEALTFSEETKHCIKRCLDSNQ